MLDMESRKRPLSSEPDAVQSKKRAIANAQGSPVHANGMASTPTSNFDDEPKDQDNLELFRKEAIYRRMKHYSRENQRSQARIDELERWKTTYEASLAVMGACWAQLIETVRDLSKPNSSEPLDADREQLLDLPIHISPGSESSLKAALEKKAASTCHLVASFVQPGTRNDDSQSLKRAQEECTTLRSELALAHSQVADLQSQRDNFRNDLMAAEIRLDRLQSRTVQSMQSHTLPSRDVADEEGEGSKSSGGPSDAVLKSSPPMSPYPNGVSAADSAGWEELAKARETTIKSLEEDRQTLRLRLSRFESERPELSVETISESPHYKFLLDKISKLAYDNHELIEEKDRLSEELRAMISGREEWEAEVKSVYGRAVEEMRALLSKRESDVVRLREQRDQQHAELNERKQKDSVKQHSKQELRNLAESHAERVKGLEAEIARLKPLVAANAGHADLAAFLARERSGEASYVEDLQKRLQQSENKLTALETSLSHFDEEHHEAMDATRREAQLREQLQDVSERLSSMEATFGDQSAVPLPPDVAQLTEHLKQRDEEIKRLKLQEMHRQQSEAALYAELDRLSSAWESLERQVKGKIFDLSAMEERLSKSALDKAKSENKFYAAMRDKESGDNERKIQGKLLEKQEKIASVAQAAESAAKLRADTLLKEVILERDRAEAYERQALQSALETDAYRTQAEVNLQKLEESRASVAAREKEYEKGLVEVRVAKEAAIKARKEAEVHAAAAKTRPQNTSAKESVLQKEVDKCMSILKCSTCRINMRNTVITKCMHSFCKQCVEARISTRQRKCPACNLGFAQSDVQQLFFQ